LIRGFADYRARDGGIIEPSGRRSQALKDLFPDDDQVWITLDERPAVA
jgi:hypothetical protein